MTAKAAANVAPTPQAPQPTLEDIQETLLATEAAVEGLGEKLDRVLDEVVALAETVQQLEEEVSEVLYNDQYPGLEDS